MEKLNIAMDLQELYRRLMNKGRVEQIEAEHQPKVLSAKTVRNINQVISSICSSVFWSVQVFRRAGSTISAIP